MRATASIPVHPMAGGAVDLDVAGTLLGPDALVDAWNCIRRDDGTLMRRPGLGSHHEPMDAAGSALNGLGLSRFDVLGLFQFDRVNDARSESPLFLAKAGDYLVASRYGTRFDIKLARHLGQRSVADFTEVYSIAEHRRYVVVCTNSRTWTPSYWNGKLSPSVSASYDVPEWGYFKNLVGAGYQEFSVFHNNRLFLAGGDPFQVVYSSSADFRDFANGGAFIMTPAFGRVTGFFRTFFGQLIIGQERALSRVIEVGPGEFDGQVIVHKVGLANNRAADMVGNDQVFISTDGQVYSLATVQEFGDVKVASMGAPIYQTLKEGALYGRPYSWAHNDREHQVIWFGLSTGNRVDRCIGYDYRHRQWLPRLANEAIIGPSCAAAWRLPRWNGREKTVFGSYETNAVSGGQRGRVWVMTPRHKEDHYLATRLESNDVTTPLHLLPKVRFPRLGGNAGWPHQGQVSAAGTYAGSSTTWTTILIRITSIPAGTGVIGTGTINASWEDVKGTHSGTLSLGSAYTPGNALALTGTGLTVAFAAPQSVAVEVGQEVWLFVDRGRKITEFMNADLYDDIDFRVGLRKVADTGRPFKNFVARVSTPPMFAGDPKRKVHLKGFWVVSRVVGARADNVIADDASPSYEATQNPFRNALDVLLKCDQDPSWQQVALLDGNSAQQYHLDESKLEAQYAADPVLGQIRPLLQFVLGASQATSDPLVDQLSVNVEYVKVDRPCKMWRVQVGQFTAAANRWNDTAPYKGFIGDFGLVGILWDVSPIPEDELETMGAGSMSKTWEVGS